MTKNDTEIARHDERLNTLEEFKNTAVAKFDTIITNQALQDVKLVKYRNANWAVGLICTTIQSIITTLAILATGHSPTEVVTFLQALLSSHS